MEKFLKWTVVFIVLVILASGGVAFYSVFMVDRGMTMPSFREMSLIDAVTHAEQMGLSVRIEQIESRLPTGRVLAQWPESGTRMRGTDRNIILKISKSGERRPIPDIRGVELTRATRMLEEQGFTLGDVVRVKDSSNSGLPAGSVIAQSPSSPGSIPIDYKVDLLVSEGSEDGKVAVPNVSQMTESAAREALERAGFRVVAIDKANNVNVVEGQVISTRPNAGALANRGDGVRITISAREPVSATPTTATTTTGTLSFPGRRSAEPDLTDSSITMLDQPKRPNENVRPERVDTSGAHRNDPHFPEFNIQVPGGATTTTSQTTPTVTTEPTLTAPATETRNKVARIRYQVPPLLRPLPIRIEIEDAQGKRVLLERNARTSETIQIDSAYSQEAKVTIWLGGESVWDDRFK